MLNLLFDLEKHFDNKLNIQHHLAPVGPWLVVPACPKQVARKERTTCTPKSAVRLCLAFFLFLFVCQGSAQSIKMREYKVKAAFLYSFSKFVDWPLTSFENAESPFVIAILGDDPFGSFLERTVAGEKVKGHPIVIQRYKIMEDSNRCHILFINTKEVLPLKEKMNEILPNTLTVSDNPEFNETGGMIRFMMKDHKIRLVINPTAIKAAELTISSKLLNVAEIYELSR
ncbi:MAG: YfiR family protein [Chitinophagaceae bacterium]